MSIETELQTRSESACELCGARNALTIFEVPPDSDGTSEDCIYICEICTEQIENPAKIDVHHWRCLNDTMWSEIPAIQVMVWRMLTRLRGEGWPQDLLDMLYLDDKTLLWAQASGESESGEETVKHVDSSGTKLEAGDTVTLIKDLNVKGAGFTAKRGTMVRGISLVAENPEHIEGRVNGQQIVILTKFVRKAS